MTQLFLQIVPPFDPDLQSTFTESFIKDGVMEKARGVRSLKAMNTLMQQNSSNASVIFTALPPLPTQHMCNAASYIDDLEAMSSQC